MFPELVNGLCFQYSKDSSSFNQNDGLFNRVANTGSGILPEKRRLSFAGSLLFSPAIKTI
jgi:hypothetical protein